MSKDAIKALADELGAPPPRSIASLGEEEIHDLVDAVRRARLRQEAELATAGQQALRHIPRLLRGPILRITR